jgi:tetratricopeptide (TPR) repeat protein
LCVTPFHSALCQGGFGWGLQLKYLLEFTGILYEGKGLYKAALKAFVYALDIDPTHVPSLVSTAVALRQLGNQSHAVVRSLLTNALRLDRMNHSAWHNLGLFYKAKGTASSSLEAAECFEAAAFLEETAPVEAFR